MWTLLQSLFLGFVASKALSTVGVGLFDTSPLSELAIHAMLLRLSLGITLELIYYRSNAIFAYAVAILVFSAMKHDGYAHRVGCMAILADASFTCVSNGRLAMFIVIGLDLIQARADIALLTLYNKLLLVGGYMLGLGILFSR